MRSPAVVRLASPPTACQHHVTCVLCRVAHPTNVRFTIPLPHRPSSCDCCQAWSSKHAQVCYSLHQHLCVTSIQARYGGTHLSSAVEATALRPLTLFSACMCTLGPLCNPPGCTLCSMATHTMTQSCRSDIAACIDHYTLPCA